MTMARKVFLGYIVVSLCSVLVCIVTNEIPCSVSNDGSPSLYEQYCCVKKNEGKLLVNRKERRHILCPTETSSSCSTLNFAPSCFAILKSHPEILSGYYNIMLDNGTVITVYCDMDGVNCDGEGGWMRVGHLDMSDPSEQCPPGFRLYEKNGIRACGRNDSECQSVKFPSHNISYTRVCGRVNGYQKGTPDAIVRTTLFKDITVDEPYVDGVSITRGNLPRNHIWTLMAAFQEDFFFHLGQHGCPCAYNSPVDPPLFMGNDYFCEAGNSGTYDFATFYTSDGLWDGKQCGLIEEPCCNVTGIPWFNKVLEQPTTDYIELRVCADQDITDEDVPVGYYNIYIK